MHPELLLWVIYDHPEDYPDKYIARFFMDSHPTDKVLVSDDLDMLRDELAARGLARLTRRTEDDPKIVETWL